MSLQIVPASAIPDGWMGLDIGPDSIKTFNEALDTTQTIIWNGPMGVFEFDKFAAGTEVSENYLLAALIFVCVHIYFWCQNCALHKYVLLFVSQYQPTFRLSNKSYSRRGSGRTKMTQPFYKQVLYV